MARNKKQEVKITAEIEKMDDGQFVKALDFASEPFSTLRAAAEDCGLDPVLVGRMLDRLKSQYQPVISEMKTVKTKELTNLLEDRAHRALSYLDDYALAKASAKDLAIVAGIMLEKRQLLRGEPTHILSSTERLDIGGLIPLLVAESGRRGLSYINEEGMVDVTPASQERATRPRRVLKDFKSMNMSIKAKTKDDSGER